ncbi:MAG TPA: cupredoxin domain-containing protein [Polyangia bacterium]|nr:cupredoxin domain-containing protein [Polyangia bacterium]
MVAARGDRGQTQVMRAGLSLLMLIVGLSVGGLGCRTTTTAPPPTTESTAPRPVAAAPAPAASPQAPAASPGAGKVALAVTAAGFEPERIPAKKGQPLTLAITRKTDQTCAREIVFQGQDGKTYLPLNKTVEITYTPKASGEIKFGCAMGMMISGVLAVSE